MNTDTPTPRTDLETYPARAPYEYEDYEVVNARFARHLERELAAAKSELAELRKAISEFCNGQKWAVDGWKNQPHIKALFSIDAARKEASHG